MLGCPGALPATPGTGILKTGAYDIECRIPVSFLLASIKSVWEGQVGGFSGEDISCPLSSPELPLKRSG